MTWKGESRRHSLARKGIKTNIDRDRRIDVSKFVARGELSLKEFPPKNMVGDGKLPNLYWVTVSNDFAIYNPDTFEIIFYSEASDDLKNDLGEDFDVESETLAVFSTYEEAKEFAENQANNTIIIEDRLSGIIYEENIYANKTWDKHTEIREDIDFTKKQMEKSGVEFK